MTAFVIGPQVSFLALQPGFALFGLGIGFAGSQLTNVILSDVEPEKSGAASGANSTVRMIGNSLGVAIIERVAERVHDPARRRRRARRHRSLGRRAARTRLTSIRSGGVSFRPAVGHTAEGDRRCSHTRSPTRSRRRPGRRCSRRPGSSPSVCCSRSSSRRSARRSERAPRSSSRRSRRPSSWPKRSACTSSGRRSELRSAGAQLVDLGHRGPQLTEPRVRVLADELDTPRQAPRTGTGRHRCRRACRARAAAPGGAGSSPARPAG